MCRHYTTMLRYSLGGSDHRMVKNTKASKAIDWATKNQHPASRTPPDIKHWFWTTFSMEEQTALSRFSPISTKDGTVTNIPNAKGMPHIIGCKSSRISRSLAFVELDRTNQTVKPTSCAIIGTTTTRIAKMTKIVTSIHFGVPDCAPEFQIKPGSCHT